VPFPGASRATARIARAAPRLGGAGLATAAVAGAPAIASAHGLSPVYQSPLPLAVYLVGAAATVALSFVFVLARDMRAGPATDTRVVAVPAAVRVGLRVIGLAGWTWIMAQAIAGGTSDAAVADLFLWIYGWVGIAMLSALVAPVWEWLDPFATLHDLLAWGLRRLGVHGWEPSEVPDAFRLWPAVAGLGFFIWLELVAIAGTATLSVVVGAYTLLTLALMAQFGRDQWRAQGETFTVWFRTLNRLASIGIVPASGSPRRDGGTGDDPDGHVGDELRDDPDDTDPDAVDDRVVIRRPFASGILEAPWSAPLIVLLAFGTGSIIFDALSQTVAFASLFGAPGLAAKTLLLFGFVGLIATAALAVARSVSPGAIGAGLLPIAVGYLVAHYLTYLLIGGQRIVIAISDPLQTGADLFGTAFYEPGGDWLPAGLVWTVQLASVVGGHMLGAWAGHVTAQRDMEALAGVPPARDRRHRKIPGSPAAPTRDVRVREIPLALVMVALTTLTLWSLGQAIVVEEEEAGGGPGISAPV
jgi:hypothetical protein